jgi:hypothetical protein
MIICRYIHMSIPNYHDFSLGCHEYNLSDVIWAGNAARLRVVEIMTPSNRTAQVGFRKAFHLPEVSWISAILHAVNLYLHLNFLDLRQTLDVFYPLYRTANVSGFETTLSLIVKNRKECNECYD